MNWIITIVVGGIVIMNIMLMSVTERTREIGIRKSLGARRGDIRRQFLVEAIVLALLGGMLGVAAGWALSVAVAGLTPLPARITGWSVGVALALGAGTGVVFGVYPAARAARTSGAASSWRWRSCSARAPHGRDMRAMRAAWSG